MARLNAAHAQPIAGGVTTLMSVGEDGLPAQKTVTFQLEDGLQWAGAAAIIGSKRPLFWGILGTMVMGIYRSR